MALQGQGFRLQPPVRAWLASLVCSELSGRCAGVERIFQVLVLGGSLDPPVPQVGEQRAPDAGRMQMPPGNPLLLSLTLQELLARDVVQVELIPEKKGLFLKHVEYEVSSQRFQSSVYRRYNDFVVFHEMLLQKFPYRMVPALPPKRMLGADREFIEARRRALKRFINLVARHPPFSEDVVLKLFLSFTGPDVQNKLKESAQYVGDEFVNCKLAARAKDFLPADIQAQFAISRELIRNVYNSFYKLRDRAERMVSRAIDSAADLLVFGKELRQVAPLGSDTTPLPSWAALSSSTWGSLKQALRGLSVEFALLADKAAQQVSGSVLCGTCSENVLGPLAHGRGSFRGGRRSLESRLQRLCRLRGRQAAGCVGGGHQVLTLILSHLPGLRLRPHVWRAVVWVERPCRACGCVSGQASDPVCSVLASPPRVFQGKQEENDVVEKLNLFLDLLQSYKDLCERHEKGVLHKHQRALHKYSLMKRQVMSAAAHNREPESVEQLESRIVEVPGRLFALQQESVIQTMELRNYFSLYCLHQETQLVHVYLPLTSHILGAFVNSQIQGHKEMSKVWNDLQPKLRCLFAGPHGSPPPQDGLPPH
ncbi:hypothetical protein CB1_000114011 [Camelus ferus]|nr:hypothetical protein CB1_000114011 [Camelus ferus]